MSKNGLAVFDHEDPDTDNVIQMDSGFLESAWMTAKGHCQGNSKALRLSIINDIPLEVEVRNVV